MKAPKLIGLTGSIGMGKSTTARMFAEAGLPVWDADAAVHRLYAPGGAAVAPVSAAFPSALRAGGIDREALKRELARDPSLLKTLESVVHPLVAADRAAWIARQEAPVVVLDVPLLFETGLDRDMDLTVVVTTDPETQFARVMARPGMTQERFHAMLEAQMPDAEKRARADRVVRSDDMETARAGVAAIVREMELGHA